jgi:A/G-specific adenine glycosylase
VGPYTARAVAALAFGRPVAAVDTNVHRVLGRILASALGPRELQRVADGLVDARDPGAWTHAVMELGATVCRARTPDCGGCPIRRWCASADAVVVTSTLARSGASAARRAAAPPFEQTMRWLRGRIVAALRQTEDGAWTALPDVIGSHGAARISEAVVALERDGLLERRADGRVRLPSSLP